MPTVINGSTGVDKVQDSIITAAKLASGQVLSVNGIQFPASQAASANGNTLDDYEEGTWTPVLGDGTNNVSTYYYQFGSYIKIGKMVYIQCTISVNNKGSITGDLRIAGLPFTPGYLNDPNDTYVLASKVFPMGTGYLYSAADIYNNQTIIYPWRILNGNQGRIQGADVGGGSQMFYSGCYIATA